MKVYGLDVVYVEAIVFLDNAGTSASLVVK